jgi:hypothetical protein
MARNGGRLSRWMWLGLFVVTVGLGAWGFADLAQQEQLTAPDVLYRTARLFTLNLDVQSPDHPPWQLWAAAVLAPLLLVRGIAELFRERLRGAMVQLFVRPEVVVLGAGHRAAALAAAAPTSAVRRWLRAVVVADADARALGPVYATGAWTVVADGLSPRSLRRAAVRRSRQVVVATGDDRLNAVVATQVQALRARGPADGDVYVEVDDPALTRALGGGEEDGDTLVAFNAAALASAQVVDEFDRRYGPVVGAGDERRSVALFGSGPLVTAMLLELRRRMVRSRAAADAPPQVVVVGPGAGRSLDELRGLLGGEPELLDITVVDDALDTAVGLKPNTALRLGEQRLRWALVLAADDIGGGPIALTVGRHLGGGGRLGLVTESPHSAFGRRIERQAEADPISASITVFRVPDRAYPLHLLQEQRIPDRLARARHELAGSTPRWSELDRATRDDRRAAESLEYAGLRLRRVPVTASTAFTRGEEQVLSAYRVAGFAELAWAGVSPDLRHPALLVRIGHKLLDSGAAEAFDVWCEIARLASAKNPVPADPAADGELADDVRRLLLLRRCQLGDADAASSLAAATTDGPLTSDQLVVVGGTPAAAPAQLRAGLEWVVCLPQLTGTVVAPTGSTGVGQVLHDLAAAAGGTFAVESPGTGVAAVRRYFINLCARAVLAGVRGGASPAPVVRVLAVPGDPGMWTVLHLLRVLGTPIGWLPVAGAGEPVPDPDAQLLGGSAGLVTLPIDRGTVRAFLRRGRWPGDPATRDAAAASIHEKYRDRQGAHKESDDPALRPFAELPGSLKDSNRAFVDDIPAKLAAAGLHLRPLAAAGWPPHWPDPATAELLAEMEHGRWNAERLLAGWESGPRDIARFRSPHLVPWDVLSTEAKEWDKQIVGDLRAALADAGLGAAG